MQRIDREFHVTKVLAQLLQLGLPSLNTLAGREFFRQPSYVPTGRYESASDVSAETLDARVCISGSP
jgi:hypothetical protein